MLVRPRETYRALANHDGDGIDSIWRGPLRTALVFGGVLSLSTAGRLSVPLLVGGTLAWAFVPALQVVCLAIVTVGLSRRRLPARRLVALFELGNAPWLLWLLAMVGWLLLHPGENVFVALPGSWVAASLLGVFLWSMSLDHAFARGVLGLGAGRSILAVALYKLLFWGSIVGFFLVSEQLQPRWIETVGAFR